METTYISKDYNRSLTEEESLVFRDYLDKVIVKATKLRQDILEGISR